MQPASARAGARILCMVDHSKGSRFYAVLRWCSALRRCGCVCCCRTTTSNAGGYGSGRNSYAGSIVDPLSGSLPGSGRSSYAGARFCYLVQQLQCAPSTGRLWLHSCEKHSHASCGGFPLAARFTCCVPCARPVLTASASASVCVHLHAGNLGLLPDGVYQRGGPGYSMPGSHPLTTLSSNASSLAGMGSLGGAGGTPLQHAGSYGGSGMHANGGSFPTSGTGASYGGAGSYPGSQGGSPTKAGFGSIGGSGSGYGPASSGPLYKSGSHGSLGGAAAAGSRGVSSAGGGGGAAGGSDAGGGMQAGGSISRGGSGVQLPGAGSWGGSSAGGHPGTSSLGGFNSAPLAGVAGG
jgi:hypothetical protein